MAYEQLHDLASRLVARGEADAAELVANHAGFDYGMLFDAADAARVRGRARPRERDRWRSVGSLLEDAAVAALRSQSPTPTHAAPDNVFETLPLVPHVTVDMGVVADRVEKEDFVAFFEELLKSAALVLKLAGEADVAQEMARDVARALDQGGYTNGELTSLIAQYITLR